MKIETIYISPESEDYTGHVTHITTGTSISETNILFMPREERDEVAENYIFPEPREEQFLDRDLAEFYRKKGY